MKNLFFLTLALILLLLSCRTIDMDGKGNSGGKFLFNSSSKAEGSNDEGFDDELDLYLEETPVEIIVIEKPVCIPEGSPIPERTPPKGYQAAANSNADGIIQPSEYSHSAMIYDFNPDFVYEVYSQPLRVTDLKLEPGERVLETPFVSDSERWLLGAGVSYENGYAVQHIYVKPARSGISASLIINTDRRVYHLILKSFENAYMPMARWRYPLNALPNNFIPSSSLSQTTPGGTAFSDQDDEPSVSVDPRFISFNYRVRYGLFRKPSWLPELAYDDGRKTYIVFPRDVLQSQLPAVFDERSNVVNYRVVEHVIVVDKLIEKITVKLAGREITIEKKGGK